MSGMLCVIHLLIVTTQLSFAFTGDLQTDRIVVHSLALRNQQWENLFMVIMVLLMIIDSHYYK